MIAGIGATGFILIILVALILFGPKKLPELGRAVGSTLSEFKKGTKEIMDTDMDDNDKEQNNVKETTMTSASTEKTSN